MREGLSRRLFALSKVSSIYSISRWDKQDLRDAAEALSRPETAQVRVRQLKWDYSELDYDIWNEDRTGFDKIVSSKHWSAMPIGMRIDYQVVQIVDPRRKAKHEGVTLNIGSKDMPFGNLDEAKAAAQADYESRIRAALEPVNEGDLDERMTAAGMIPLSELLESHGPMEKFKQHAAVKTFDDFVWWVKSQQKQFMTMRMRYELGDKDKGDDLFEWVFAHAAVYDQIATQLRALEPDTVTGWQANPLSSLPYDTPIVLLLESGNVAQSVWYDEPKESFLRRFNHTPAIGWLDLPLPPAPEKEG